MKQRGPIGWELILAELKGAGDLSKPRRYCPEGKASGLVVRRRAGRKRTVGAKGLQGDGRLAIRDEFGHELSRDGSEQDAGDRLHGYALVVADVLDRAADDVRGA